HRQELLGTVSLAGGVFVGLALLPLDLTGPAGRWVGTWLWDLFGLGAAMLPALGLGVGLAAFGRFSMISPKRMAVLFSGLAILVPYALAIAVRARGVAVEPDITLAPTLQRLAGVVPMATVTGIGSIVGTAGATLIGLLALSGV